ncbi:putative uncharacterized protein [Xanthomonas citri pv. punicae str. LMG 859]|nr:putative uncharacterized protein [Xanthomonas citri pv. punicae str. LMG 859]
MRAHAARNSRAFALTRASVGVNNGVRRDHAVEQAARPATLPTSSTAPMAAW